jgi:uncharacterized membrane protein (UPF0182 family)
MPRTSRRFRIGVVLGVVVVVAVIASLRTLATFWTDYLWFRGVGFTSVFRGVLLNQVILAAIFTAAFFAMMMVSLSVADRLAPRFGNVPEDEIVVRYRPFAAVHGRTVRIIVSAVFALLAGIGTKGEWNNWVLFLHRTNFHQSDPLNHLDYGFYIFQLPFIKFLVGWLFAAVIVVIMVTALAYYLNGGINFQATGNRVGLQVKTHLSVLLGILALIKAAGYYLDRLSLVLSRRYVVNGATYTVVHALRPADLILIVVALFAVGLFLYNIRQKGWLLPGVAVGVWILVYLLVGVAYPAFIQAVRVAPSEITRERPYIADNITATQDAMGLDNVTTSDQTIGESPINASQVTGNSASAQANQLALHNVRLLDPQYIAPAFNKDQEIRGYYRFQSLDIDRYKLNGKLTETLLAPRELNPSGVPGGFVNQKLEYTHGYGAALAPANEDGVDGSGAVNYSLSDLPPTGQPSLSVQPRIYYGAASPSGSYVIAHSKQPELDYENPVTQQEVTNSYQGSGGVPAGSLLRRAAFALRFGDPNILLSGQIDPASRVMYYRNVTERAEKAAPFLQFDNTPYAVVLNGQIDWILDAYTTSNNFPYAQEADTSRVGQATDSLGTTTFNYVRNSVKVVISAYSGKMRFFVVDPTDPVIRTYEKAFPDLFTPVSKADHMFPGITNHWRYPQDLFIVQTNMYGRYHLSDPNQFYSEAQAWDVAQDPGSGVPGQGTVIGSTQVTPTGQVITNQAARFTPTYLITHLPGQTQEQFLLLEPFVPISQGDKQQNLTGFLTAESNQQGQGSLQVFTTPPGSNINGPLQAGALINATSAISTRISFLDQHGSQVLLGNLVMVPIDNTLLYVEPLYVAASDNPVPKLDDVIVVYNGTAYDSGNASLDAALCQVTNPDGSQPFQSYCNTRAAGRPSQTPGVLGSGSSNGSSGSSTSTSTTTPSTTTPPTSAPSTGSSSTTLPAPQGTTVAQLVANANKELAAAQGALTGGNLAAYQADVTQARADLAQAAKLEPANTTAPKA